MSEFQNTILSEVRRRGRVTFAEFMKWALYHPIHGYYAAGGERRGRGGDFFTSVGTGGLFGRLLAESVTEMWDHLGSGRLTLVELGASDGGLAEQVLKALEGKGRAKGVSVHLVEKSGPAREAARRRLARFPRVHLWEDLDEMEHTAGVEGVVYSNEFFDALPVHRVRMESGALQEFFVVEKDGRLVEEAGEPSTPRLARCFEEQEVHLAEGQAAEVCPALEEVVEGIDRVLARGFVITVDYGEPSVDLYREDRRDGTLRTFRKHAVGGDPFQNIGEQDITAHVDFGRLAALGARGELDPLLFCSQGSYFLNSCEGLLRKVVEEEGKQDPSMSRRVQQLLHPEGMGGAFHVLVQGKNVGRPELSGGKANRLHRLVKMVNSPP
jgi:SAM-dependent MidA family methyltransferase